MVAAVTETGRRRWREAGGGRDSGRYRFINNALRQDASACYNNIYIIKHCSLLVVIVTATRTVGLGVRTGTV
jgi:hypothetical protein